MTAGAPAPAPQIAAFSGPPDQVIALDGPPGAPTFDPPLTNTDSLLLPWTPTIDTAMQASAPAPATLQQQQKQKPDMRAVAGFTFRTDSASGYTVLVRPSPAHSDAFSIQAESELGAASAGRRLLDSASWQFRQDLATGECTQPL